RSVSTASCNRARALSKMTPWTFSRLISRSVGMAATSSNLTIGVGSSAGWPMILLQRPTHSSQMNTLGPAMSLATLCWLLPQNEQWSVGCSPLRRDHGKRDAAFLSLPLRVMNGTGVKAALTVKPNLTPLVKASLTHGEGDCPGPGRDMAQSTRPLRSRYREPAAAIYVASQHGRRHGAFRHPAHPPAAVPFPQRLFEQTEHSHAERKDGRRHRLDLRHRSRHCARARRRGRQCGSQRFWRRQRDRKDPPRRPQALPP